MISRFVYAFATIGSAAILAACAQSYSPSPSSLAVPPGVRVASPGSVTEKVVYSFAGGKDGSFPQGAPILINGTLYGTTVPGGGAGCAFVHGCGTVYAIDASGSERVLHAFKSGADGEAPNGSLLLFHTNLYGTTVLGGNAGCKNGRVKGCGTIFEIGTAGSERVLYRFPGKKFGARPNAGLTLLGDALYGEAAAGGAGTCYYGDIAGCGTIFKLQSPSKPQTIFTFLGGKNGGSPNGGLVVSDDAVYGVTSAGGGKACLSSYGCGTAFRVNASGGMGTLHRFGRSVHAGASPESAMIKMGDEFYGTTFSGGSYDCALTGSFIGCGTIFALSSSGTYRQIYSFPGGGGGAYPNGLIVVDGILYGTAGDSTSTCGIFFSITPNGDETILYHFQGGSDGCGPTSSLHYVRETFYGTTGLGGAHGDGTVFAITL
jgi:uncharacterized repeat protein (TIGR03803 family)